MKYYNIPIFVPHCGCPFSCVFCNQKHIAGDFENVDAAQVRAIIEEHLATLPKGGRTVEAAFFGGSFTGIEVSKQVELLGAAQEYLKRGSIDGIRLSTRPDYIDDEIMQRLVGYGVTTVELGVQSMDNEVLRLSGRGHTDADVIHAVDIIRKYPVKLGLQMMTGLPGDNGSQSRTTARRIIELKPDCVRIYPTLVIKDTALETLYHRGEYRPQELFDAVELAAELLVWFRENNIDVIRVGLAATEEIAPGGALVSGPYHSAFGELAEGEIFYNKMLSLIEDARTVKFAVNPKDISKAVGNSRRNVIRLKENGINAVFVQDCAVKIGDIALIKSEG